MRFWEILNELDPGAEARRAAVRRQEVEAARRRKSNAAHKYQDAVRRANNASSEQQAKKANASRRYQDQMRAATDAERTAASKS